MREYIDLHTHSTCSDGSFTPKEIIAHADEIGLYAVALTDHDNIDGILEAKKEALKRDIIFIPGIEISCDFSSELHIVGLNIDCESEKLVNLTNKFKEDRKKRNINTIKRLNDAGIDINLEEAKKYSTGNALGRAHIAKVMVDKGYASSVKDAFKKYLGKGKVGYSNEFRISYKDAISVIKESGGVAILAHCHYLNMNEDEFIEFIKELKSYGLNGLEGYYTEYTKEQSDFYISVCKKLDLIISGGSDFHGDMKPDIKLGKGFGNLKVPKTLLDNF
ncbi:MAG: PHP domain-containing protein [Ruminococcaceae bacterium]|nr:PHP domain-containing protein [Oscillospiraceae bacterium]